MNEGSSFAALQKENIILIQKNSQLTQDIQTLKKQFSSAVDVSSAINQIHQKNSDLLEQIHGSNAEIDDLKRRLQIALRNVDELNEKLSNEKQRVHFNTTNEIESLKQKIENERNEHNSKISQIQEKANYFESDLNKKESLIKQNEIEMKSIFQASSQHFGQLVDNTDTLLRLLLIPPEITESQETIVADMPIVEKSKKKRKKQKKNEYREQEKVYNDQKSVEIIRKELESSYEQKIKELNSSNAELKNKIERLSEENGSLKQNSTKTSEENSQLKVQMQCIKNDENSKSISQLIEKNEKIKIITAQLNSSEKANEIMKKQISPLLSKLHYFEKQNKSILKKLELTQSLSENLQNKNDKFVEENDNLQNINNEAQSRLIQITKRNNELQTVAKQLQASLNEKIAENQKLIISINSLQQSCQVQSDEIQVQKSQIESLLQMQKKDAEKSEKLTLSIQLLEKNNKILEETVKTAQQKLMKSNEPVESAMLLPLSVWSIPELPNDIVDTVQQVANNNTLKTPTKLRQVLTIVCNYFISRNKRNEQAVNDFNEKEAKNQTKLLKLIDFFKNLFPEISADFNDLLDNEELHQKMKDAFTNLRNNEKSMSELKGTLEKQVLDLLLFLQVDSTQEALSVVREMNDISIALEKTNKKLSLRISEMKKKFESLRTSFDDQNSKLQKNNEKKQGLIEELEKEIKSLKDEISNLNKKFENERENFKLQMHENKVVLDAKSAEYSKQNAYLHEQINIQKSSNQTMQENIESLKSELSKASNTIQLLRRNKQNLLNQIQENLSIGEEKTKEQTQVILNEREIFGKRLKEEKEVFTSKINEMSELYEIMKEKAENLENLNSNLTAQFTDLTLRVQKAELKYNTAVKEAERDKLITESHHRTEILNMKSDFQDQIAEKEALIGDTKRNIMSFVALQFCSLFDANVEMNETNFSIFVNGIKAKLTELLYCDSKLRNLLQIGPNQSPVDSVAQLLLSTPQMLAKY